MKLPPLSALLVLTSIACIALGANFIHAEGGFPSDFNPHKLYAGEMLLPSTPQNFTVNLSEYHNDLSFVYFTPDGKTVFRFSVNAFKENYNSVSFQSFKWVDNSMPSQENKNVRYGETQTFFDVLDVKVFPKNQSNEEMVSFSISADTDIFKTLPARQVSGVHTITLKKGQPAVSLYDSYFFYGRIKLEKLEGNYSIIKYYDSRESDEVDCEGLNRLHLLPGEKGLCGKQKPLCIGLKSVNPADQSVTVEYSNSCDGLTRYRRVFEYLSLEDIFFKARKLEFTSGTGKQYNYRFRFINGGEPTDFHTVDFDFVDITPTGLTVNAFVNGTQVCFAHTPNCIFDIGKGNPNEVNQDLIGNLGRTTGLVFLFKSVLVFPSGNADIGIQITGYDKEKLSSTLGCKRLEYNGPSEGKLDVLIAPGNNDVRGFTYNYDLEEPSGRADFLNDSKERINVFYKVKAFAKNRQKINFWYIDNRAAQFKCSSEGNMESTFKCEGNIKDFLALCPQAEYVMVLIPNLSGSREIGRSWADDKFAIDGGTTPEVFVHEAAHVIFELSDTYCCDGGYVSETNVYHGDEAYAESILFGRNLSAALGRFKAGIGSFASFDLPDYYYRLVTVLRPEDLMANHLKPFLNFDAEYWVDLKMKGYK